MVLGIKARYETGGGNYLMRSDHVGLAYIKDAKTIYVFDFVNELLLKPGDFL